MSSHSGEISLFLRRWLANPLRVGAILPSSKALAKLVGKNAVRSKQDIVLELGAGTGTITRGLLQAGLPEANVILVELDPDLVRFLRRRFPKATVIEGDATRPLDLLPREFVGQVDCVISGIPALQFPLDKQRSYMDQCFAAARPDGQVLQYTYSLKSPLPYQLLEMTGRRLGLALANIPPAHLWGYSRRPAMAAAAE
jgi:phosphatidylethanolamine/phosphatidyl-N-methylethanolamine N-methyltransferase